VDKRENDHNAIMSSIKTTVLWSLFCSVGFAADTCVVQRGEMIIRPTFPATVLPRHAVPIVVQAEEWQNFTIQDILPHGSKVKKGEVLVRFDDEDYARKLRDAELAMESSALQLQNIEVEYQVFHEQLPSQLEAAKKKAEHAAEAFAYFEKTRKEAETTEAHLSLRQTELRLESAREELVQLEKMYKADDLTENTEEIILKRQRETVKALEISLDLAKLSHRRKLEVSLLREGEELKRAAQSAAAEWQQTEKNLPRQGELKRVARDEARLAMQRRQQNWEKLQKEQSSFIIRAPEDGWFYYGTMQDGRWSINDAQKGMATGQIVLPKKPFASFVPVSSPLQFHASVDEATARVLQVGKVGCATMTGRMDETIKVSVVKLSAVPHSDMRYPIVLAADDSQQWKEIVAGMTAQIDVLVCRNTTALMVPRKALRWNENGTWTVECLLDDQKPKTATVRVVRMWGDQVEIDQGVEEGQKLFIPQ
jgi:multidrug efflux pump subunit AcrA (membrane-fusion protein)